MSEAFFNFDEDGSGKISLSELRRIVTSSGEGFQNEVGATPRPIKSPNQTVQTAFLVICFFFFIYFYVFDYLHALLLPFLHINVNLLFLK